MLKQNILKTFSLLMLSNIAFAQTPKYDTSFGSGGRVNLNMSGFTNEIGNGIKLANDGKVVCVGHDRTTNAAGDKFVISRYTTAGKLDAGFNGKGFNAIELIPATSKDFGYDAIVLSDNSILGVGYSTGANGKTSAVIVKFKVDGTIDNSFGGNNNGRSIINFGNSDKGKAILEVSNGFLIGGDIDGAPGVIKLKKDGTLDSSWNGTGFSDITTYNETINTNEMILDKNGNIVLVGGIEDNSGTKSESDMFWIRFNANGSIIDTLRKIGTKGNLEVCYDVVQENDGNFILVGTKNTPSIDPNMIDKQENIIVRLDVNGNFVKNVITDYGVGKAESYKGVALQSDGTIIVVGNVDQQFLVVRHKKDLSLDPSFTQTKYAFGFKTELNDVVINWNQQIFACGYDIASGSGDNNFILAKFHTNLTSVFDADANTIPLSVFPNPTANVLNISYQLDNAGDVTIEIYDLLGKQVANYAQGFRSAEAQTEKIELSNLATGTYICRLVTKDGASNSRFSVLK